MLVLTRKIGEAIIVGEGAQTKGMVLNVKENQVKFGIEVPQSIVVDREEISELKIKSKAEESEKTYTLSSLYDHMATEIITQRLGHLPTEETISKLKEVLIYIDQIHATIESAREKAA